ncbi:hypothetical protein [Kordiimonas pumila]|uniref:Phosphatidate cytidylyltransferase n=1 Tax=Kordiimonas pumila TaxID=2161677 RepID=A0ABV7D403_9PROT|nr:hypothetical protein [Kordiimonas pumila]
MPTSTHAAVVNFIHHEWQRSVPEPVMLAAADIASNYGDAVVGVLFYGSCLRTGEIEDKVLDFYVIVDSYKAAYKKRWLAIANKMLPPNVFYHEMDACGIKVRSKYAVLSLHDLGFRVSSECLNVSVWARFCQPCYLLQATDANTRSVIEGYVADAVITMLSNILKLKPTLRVSRDMWVAAFEQTYAAELRSERKGKGLEIYLLDQERYDMLTPVAFDALGLGPQVKQPSRIAALKAQVIWALRRWNGKIVSFLRLIKASMTFDGGIDYLAWKIKRHSGVEIEVTDWMRKHPVLAGVTLFWRLRKKGAFK